MTSSFVDRFFVTVFFLLLIKDSGSAAGAAFLRTDAYEQLKDATTATYVDDVTPTSDFDDVTDFLTVPGEVTDDTTTSSQHIASFTPDEAPDVTSLKSTIDTFSVIVTTMNSKYPSLSTLKSVTAGNLITSAEIGHWSDTMLSSSSIAMTAAASIWSPSLTSKGDSVSMLNANASVGATSNPSTLLSSDNDALISTTSTTSSSGSQNMSVTTQATTWRGTNKNSFTPTTSATLSGASKSFADIAVPTTLSITTERTTVDLIQSTSPVSNKSTLALMPLTTSGVTHNSSVFSHTTLSATKDLFTNSRLTTSPGTTRSAFSITSQPDSLGTTRDAATIATPVTSTSLTSAPFLVTFSRQATTPVDSNYATTISVPPTWSGTVKNVLTLSKLMTSPGTTKKVVMVSTPEISQASMQYFSITQIICALLMSRMFIY